MSGEVTSTKYYADHSQLQDIQVLEQKFTALVDYDIQSLADFEGWLARERTLSNALQEAMMGHKIDFYRDTTDSDKRDVHRYDQLVISPLLMGYQAALDKKFCDCPWSEELDGRKYGYIRKIRQTKVALFREGNIALAVREQELGSKYSEAMSGRSVLWQGEAKPYPFVRAQLDNSDRAIRETAWRALAKSRSQVKPEVNQLMNELVQVRHQMAVNAGFANYRDYMFKVKNREYSIADCEDFHACVERHIVPAWNRLIDVIQLELGVDTVRPWDSDHKMLQGAPFSTVTELMDGVQEMFVRTDPYFADRFQFMRASGLLDLEARHGKHAGGFMELLPTTKNTFVFANFSPSFDAVIALIHEMGHAVNGYLQFANDANFQEQLLREEAAELYSHGMELLLLDKLDTFYTDSRQLKRAQREELRRALGLLIGPLTRDIFEHWMYTHPNHTAKERDEKFLELSKRFRQSPVEMSGLESEVASSWIDTTHYFLHPFYAIEYSMSELGALQLLEISRDDPQRAVALYKQGAGANVNQSIAGIYQDTGVEFDFSERVVQRTAELVECMIAELGQSK